MRILIFINLFIFTTYLSSGQNVLQLKNTETGKTRILKPGMKLHFKSTQDASFVKGKIVQIKDTSIVIYCPDYSEEDPLVDLPMTELQSIKKATTLHSISRSIGSVLIPVGTYLFINGILTLSRDNQFQGAKTYDEDLTKALTFTGGGFMIGGVIPFLIKTKVYDFSKEWTVSVIKINKK